VNIEGAKKGDKILCEKVHNRAQSFISRLYISHDGTTKTFLLVSSSVRSKRLLCFVHGQGQKSEQKNRTKNSVAFHNHSPLLTMVQCEAGKKRAGADRGF